MSKCLNVAMTNCFWCGEVMGIAIGDKLVDCKNKLKTQYVFGGYEPCDKCKERMAKGFTIMIAQDKPISNGQPEMQKGVYPTGQWLVISNEAKERMFNVDKDKCFMDRETAIKLGLFKLGLLNE